jgi:RNA polymerase subunit RPABC4/transcription elongation factor Spt4
MAENVKESEYEDKITVECQECGRVTDDSDAMCSFCREEMEQDDW